MDSKMIDPVCGMKVTGEVAQSRLLSNYKSETYHFCSTECKQKFDDNPDRYIHKNHMIRGTI
jgi:YHS domain-containing protein